MYWWRWGRQPRPPSPRCVEPRSSILDAPANRWRLARAVRRLGGDGASAPRRVGDAVLYEKGPLHGPVHLLADFGPSAAPYADRVGASWTTPKASPPACPGYDDGRSQSSSTAKSWSVRPITQSTRWRSARPR